MQHPPQKTLRRRKGMRIAIVAVLMLLAAAAALVCLRLQSAPPAVDVQTENVYEGFQTLEIRDVQELSSVTVCPDGAQSYILAMQDGRLYLHKDGEMLDINDTYADELLEVFTHIVSEGTVTQDASEVEEHLSDMGLAPARAKAVIRYQDGTEAVLEVGAAVPNTTYAYYRWSGDPGIYMCDAGIKELFSITQNHLLPVQQPVIHAALVEELRLSNAAGESLYQFADATSGKLVEPYRYPLSAASVDLLLGALENFRLGTREAALNRENRASYGFDDPLCVLEVGQKEGFTNRIAEDGSLVSEQMEAQSYRFVIGRAEGDYFYTCEYEGDCYLISRFLVEALVRAEPAALITRNPADMGDAMIASITLKAPAGSWAVDVLRAERVLPNNELERDETGRIVYDTLVLVNGEEKPADLLAELNDRLYTLTVAGNVPDTFALDKDAKPRWSLTVETTSAERRQIDAYRMDAFSDAIMVDGVMRHYVHADAIDVLSAGLE